MKNSLKILILFSIIISIQIFLINGFLRHSKSPYINQKLNDFVISSKTLYFDELNASIVDNLISNNITSEDLVFYGNIKITITNATIQGSISCYDSANVTIISSKLSEITTYENSIIMINNCTDASVITGHDNSTIIYRNSTHTTQFPYQIELYDKSVMNIENVLNIQSLQYFEKSAGYLKSSTVGRFYAMDFSNVTLDNCSITSWAAYQINFYGNGNYINNIPSGAFTNTCLLINSIVSWDEIDIGCINSANVTISGSSVTKASAYDFSEITVSDAVSNFYVYDNAKGIISNTNDYMVVMVYDNGSVEAINQPTLKLNNVYFYDNATGKIETIDSLRIIYVCGRARVNLTDLTVTTDVYAMDYSFVKLVGVSGRYLKYQYQFDGDGLIQGPSVTGNYHLTANWSSCSFNDYYLYSINVHNNATLKINYTDFSVDFHSDTVNELITYDTATVIMNNTIASRTQPTILGNSSLKIYNSTIDELDVKENGTFYAFDSWIDEIVTRNNGFSKVNQSFVNQGLIGFDNSFNIAIDSFIRYNFQTFGTGRFIGQNITANQGVSLSDNAMGVLTNFSDGSIVYNEYSTWFRAYCNQGIEYFCVERDGTVIANQTGNTITYNENQNGTHLYNITLVDQTLYKLNFVLELTSIIIDLDPPTGFQDLQTQQPQNTDENGYIWVNGTASDGTGSGVREVIIQEDNITSPVIWSVNLNTNESWAFRNESYVPDGAWAIKVNISDMANHFTIINATIFVDTQCPNGIQDSATKQPQIANVYNKIWINGTVDDPLPSSGIKSLYISASNATGGIGIWSTNQGNLTHWAFYNISGPIEPNNPGEKYNINITIEDNASNLNEIVCFINVTIDTIKPTVIITYPVNNGDFINNNTVFINGTCEGTGSKIYSVSINDTNRFETVLSPQGTNGGVFSFKNKTYLSDGIIAIEINVTDYAKNQKIVIVWFIMNNLGPRHPLISLETPAGNGTAISGAQIIISGKMWGMSSHIHSIWINNSDFTLDIDPSGSSQGSFSFSNSSSILDGIISIFIVGNNTDGLSASILVWFYIDNTNPTMPSNFQVKIQGSSIYLSWNEVTDLTNVTYLIYRDNINIANTTQLFYLDDNVEPGKTYIYQIQAIDSAGNIGTITAGQQITIPKELDNFLLILILSLILIGAISSTFYYFKKRKHVSGKSSNNPTIMDKT